MRLISIKSRMSKLRDMLKMMRIVKRGVKSGNANSILSVLIIKGVMEVWKLKGLLPKKSVKGEHIVITGAGSGIGRRLAILLGERGAKISCVGIIEASERATSKMIIDLGGNSHAHICNVGDQESVSMAFASARDTFGPISMLINNAGIVNAKNIIDSTLPEIEKVIRVNLISHFITIKEALPDMIAARKGHIVTLSSSAGLIGVNKLADYSASKFGVFGMTESLRMEMKKKYPGIRTTIVCPFYINTGMFKGVKTRFSLLLPILEEEYAAHRILNAILQNEQILIMPLFVQLVLWLRAIASVDLFDKVAQFMGISSSLDDFKGRDPNLTSIPQAKL